MSPEPESAIDLHCHLLPGLDDGARDLADAVAMARQAEADGIAAICATPHIRHDHDVRIHELSERRARLAADLAAAGCTVRVLPGGEVAASSVDDLSDGDLEALTLGGGGRWILLEPVPGPLDDRIDAAVEALRARGFAAVVAHPERHGGPDFKPRLARLVERGCIVQATAAFFTSGDSPTAAGMLELAGDGLVHVLGSDAHSSRAGRPVALSAAYAALRGVPTIAPHVDWMALSAPHAIVSGAEVRAPF